MIEIYYKNKKLDQQTRIDDFREGSWINIENAEENDLRKIAELTGLEYADLEEALDPLELPRIERHDEGVIIFVQAPNRDYELREMSYTNLVTLIITDKYFISISRKSNSIIRRLIEQSASIFTTQRSRLLVYFLLQISKSFIREIKVLRGVVFPNINKNASVTNADILALIKHEEVFNQYLYSLVPLKNVFELIAAGHHVHLFEHDTDLIEDTIINIRQSVDLSSISVKTIRSLRESFQIVFTNRLNKTIQFLTAFTIILTIPTIIASVYGMNVKLPFGDNPLAFIYVLGFTAVVALIFAIFFYRRKWF